MNGGLIFVCCFFGGVALMCLVIWKVADFIDNWKDKKHHKEHPEFFRLRDDYIAKANRACNFHNKTIVSYMRKIDDMMKEADYLPQEVINQHEGKIEELRSQLFAAKSVEKGYDDMAKEARKKWQNISMPIISSGLGIGTNPQLSACICSTDKLQIKNQPRLATPRPGFQLRRKGAHKPLTSGRGLRSILSPAASVLNAVAALL